jgi:hypothetical protein
MYPLEKTTTTYGPQQKIIVKYARTLILGRNKKKNLKLSNVLGYFIRICHRNFCNKKYSEKYVVCVNVCVNLHVNKQSSMSLCLLVFSLPQYVNFHDGPYVLLLKGPKCGIFVLGIFAQIRPIWIGYLGTRPKNPKKVTFGALYCPLFPEIFVLVL